MRKKSLREKASWRLLDHTADIRLEATGHCLEDMFLAACAALSEFLDPNGPIRKDKELEVSIEGEGLDELLVNWLREILFHNQARNFSVSDANILALSNNRLTARLVGGDRSCESDLGTEVKGITYHGLSIKKSSDTYLARVVLDI